MKGDCVASNSLAQPDTVRLLLDQGFPKPSQFAITSLDRSVTVEHFGDFAPELAAMSTPDWYVYCVAAEAGFDALVVRDRSQLDQLAEMFVLSRLKRLSIVTWRKGIDDPIREWGQLLAYLPDIRQRCIEAGGRAILLPAPSLNKKSFFGPAETVSAEARTRRISVEQIRREARSEIADWLEINDEPADRFDEVLQLR